MLITQLIAQTNKFGDRGFQPPGSAFEIDATSADSAKTGALTNLESFVSQMLGFLTITASLFFIVYFFMGAFKWITAGGDGGKVGKARDEMIQGVLGLIVIVAAYSIIGLIGTVVGLNILQPAVEIEKILRMRN